MSQIVAILWRDGRPADPSVMARLGQRSGSRTDFRCWAEGSVALGVSGNSCTGEPIQLARDEARNVTVALDGRLDNVADLSSALGWETNRFATDCDWVLAAFHKWGDDCVERLLGDFAFAVWDGFARRLSVARDPLGARSLYYYLAEDVCVFASRIETLTETQLVPKEVDYGRVLDALVEPLEGADYTRTFYKSVRRLTPATILNVEGQSVKQSTYWSLVDAATTCDKSDSDWLEGIQFHLRQAVACRIATGRVGAMLSGGLDSSAIAVQVQQVLSNPDALPCRRLDSFPFLTFALDSDFDSADSRCSGELAAHLGLTSERIDANAIASAELDDCFLHSGGPPFDSFMLLAALVYSRARTLGLNAVLDGIDGDLVFGMHGNYIPWLIRQGQIGSAFREISAAGGSLTRSTAANLLNALPDSLHVWRSEDPTRVVRQQCQASIVCPGFAEQYDVQGRFRDLRQWGRASNDFRRQQAGWMAHPFATAGMERYQRVANHFGIEPRHPLFDVRLLEYCVNLPWSLRARGGWSKIGLRRAISDAVPSTVAWRNESDNLYPEVAKRFLRRHEARLEAFVEDELDDSLKGIVDVEKVASSLQKFKLGDAQAGNDVWQALYLSQWLKSV